MHWTKLIWKFLKAVFSALLAIVVQVKVLLIRLINLLERPNEGQVIINQKDFTALDARSLRQERANIGMIFQHFNLLQTKTVAENIEMPMRLLNYSKAEREKRLNELLEFIDLKHKKMLIRMNYLAVRNNVLVSLVL